ncbi:unnamed protein product [Withania somnifera]
MASSSLFINPITSSHLHLHLHLLLVLFQYLQVFLIFLTFCTPRTDPISLICRKDNFLLFKRKFRGRPYKKRSLIAASKLAVKEYNREEEEEYSPPLIESEVTSKSRRIAIFVEPSPFSYVSGYKNRFQNFIRYLREMGDEVMVVTTHEGVPQEFYGAKLIGSLSFPCPWYPRIISEVARFKPDIIHASSPGIMVFGALIIAKLLCLPIVMSYHTHVPVNGEPDKPLIIHVGRLGVEKSLDFIKRLMDRLPEARIAFIGDGPYREELEKMFSGMPVVFTGMLLGEELSQAYASGDIFAMSSGLPVLAARAGGIPDIIPDDQQGKTGSPLLHNAELRETIGRAAREEMEKSDWRAATRKIRNEQYSAAIWFWRKKRAQLMRPFQWLFKRRLQTSGGL